MDTRWEDLVIYAAGALAAIAAGCAIGLGIDVLLERAYAGSVAALFESRAPEGSDEARLTRVALAGAESSLDDDLWRDAAWYHPLGIEGEPPTRIGRMFGAARPGRRPHECGRGHCGVDVGRFGMDVLAARAGVVDRVERRGTRKAGRYVRILHRGGLVTYYMHLHHVREDLREGMSVAGGEVIGVVGRTGIHRSEPHLHFAVARREGEHKIFLDPEPLLAQALP